METFKLELHPETEIHVALFQNVSNASELKQRFIDQDQTLTCCLINAKLVINLFHVLLAANRAVSEEAAGKLKTHNIHSEILYNFGLTNNISKTFRAFGISDDTTDVVVVKVGHSAIQAKSFITECVKGDLVPLNKLVQITDLKEIEKVYQLGDQHQNPSTIMSLVAGGMALRGH